ncbi:MAG TPA: biopolymer transporter ExbD [Kofleriaceae bacterium]|nr:biopolymer transporter ExbD [Kofleriaceae bacterium]
MGATLGASDKRSVNVELNIVPFIDLMSCLTAFLLVTAVWVNMASVKNEPVGPQNDLIKKEPPPKLSILVEYDQILVQASPSGEARQVGAFDWPRLEDALREFKTEGQVPQVEVAAASTGAHPIPYQQLIAAMDTVQRAGYPRVGVIDPAMLAR